MSGTIKSQAVSLCRLFIAQDSGDALRVFMSEMDEDEAVHVLFHVCLMLGYMVNHPEATVDQAGGAS